MSAPPGVFEEVNGGGFSGQKRDFQGGFVNQSRAGGDGTVKLFVGSVPRTIREEEIRPMFDEFGSVLEVALIKDKATGQQRGCAFIKYASLEEAERAIKGLHNQRTLPGGNSPVQVRFADGERERLGIGNVVEYKLFVGSMSKNYSEKQIEEIFAKFGPVEDVYIMRDQEKMSRGCAFVKFHSRETAQAAIDGLHGKFTAEGMEQPVAVRFADPKRQRPGEAQRIGGPGAPPQGGFQSGPPQFAPRPGGNMNVQRGPPGQAGMRPGAGPGPRPGMPPAMGGGPGWRPMGGPGMGPPGPLGPMGGPGAQMGGPRGPYPAQGPPQMMGMMPGGGVPGQMGMMPPQQQQGQPMYFQHMPQNAPRGPAQQVQGMPPQHMQQQQPQHVFVAPQQQQQQQQQVQPQLLQQPQQQQPQAVQGMPQQGYYQMQAVPQLQSPQGVQALQQQPQAQQQVPQVLQQQQQQPQQAPSGWQPAAQQVPLQAPALQAAATPALTAGAVAGAGTTPATCDWSEHTSPEGHKYYYNSVTAESRWEKPAEMTAFEASQQQQVAAPQQAMTLLQPAQQQQIPALQQQQQQQQPVMSAYTSPYGNVGAGVVAPAAQQQPAVQGMAMYGQQQPQQGGQALPGQQQQQQPVMLQQQAQALQAAQQQQQPGQQAGGAPGLLPAAATWAPAWQPTGATGGAAGGGQPYAYN
eukprot:TRINITY_DN17172_c0_g1_i1.p1 TRINITY_DN17172_c0_g1~~TRINITY_DN17172_c0_g1_i1.p1  ORF type:complete len:688 (+),score=262.13 TRINITY_DN17172_c0_g1_i1:187-2250(+)